MPDIDGVELIRFLGQADCTCPVLVTSAFPTYLGMIMSLGNCLGLEAIDGQTKPMGVKDLRGFLVGCINPAEHVIA